MGIDTGHQSSELTGLLQSQLCAGAEEMKEESASEERFLLKRNNFDLLTIYQEDVQLLQSITIHTFERYI